VLVRLNHQDNRALFDGLDVELLTGSQLDLWALDHLVDQSSPDWLRALTRSGGLRSVTVSEHQHATVAEFDRALPDRTFVVSITRDGETRIPETADRLNDGYQLSLIGRHSAIEEAISLLSPQSDKAGTRWSLIERNDSTADDNQSSPGEDRDQ
jgi:hypothetical protein